MRQLSDEWRFDVSILQSWEEDRLPRSDRHSSPAFEFPSSIPGAGGLARVITSFGAGCRKIGRPVLHPLPRAWSTT
jgi:hypothetical protein